MGSIGCTFICMAISFRFFRRMGPSEPDRYKTPGVLLPILLAVLVSVSCAICASARPAKGFETATLVETETYIPCGLGCSLAVEPARAFCFRLGDQVLVGEGRSYLHEGKLGSMEELAGKQVPIRVSRRSIWIRPLDGPTMRIGRGSLFENFKAAGCIAEVHKPILARANSSRRPAKIPADAVAIAGSGRGDFQPLFLWFQCALDSDAATIACRRWYGNGDSDGKDWYCARTVDGAPVGADFALDPLLSQAGRLVLKSGAVLRHDGRARTNDQLDRPGEACR
jgi:hypothetical protein